MPPTTQATRALQTALDLAERQRDAARQQAQQAQAAHQAAQAQLEQLQGYAHETQNRWGLRAHSVAQPAMLRNHSQFLARLEHAMALQGTVVQQCAERVQAAQEVLRSAEQRLAALHKLLAERARQAAQAEARREQKQTDERAAVQYAARLRLQEASGV